MIAMESIIKNELSEVLSSGSGQKILQVWSKECNSMCEWEFMEQIDNISSTAEVFNSKMLYIDASEFCYEISEKAMQQINEYFSGCDIVFIGIVICKSMLGKQQILKLIYNISNPSITLRIFKTTAECMLAFLEK